MGESRKAGERSMRLFLLTLLNGVTLGALYFIVAAGFTLIFGLMRNVNLAHGSLYLLGGYLGYGAIAATDSWLAGLAVAFLLIAVVGMALQVLIFRRMEGQDLRQTLVTIALSLILADLMLWRWGGDYYQVPMRVRFRISHNRRPTTMARARMKRRSMGYCR